MRVSFSNVERLTGGLGVLVESLHTRSGGELLLHGALDVERKFGGSKTVTEVSGERLRRSLRKAACCWALGLPCIKDPLGTVRNFQLV